MPPGHNIRDQLLANVKFLYGGDAEIFTTCVEGLEQSYQAFAAFFDPTSSELTKYFHGPRVDTSSRALLQMTVEIEKEIGRLLANHGHNVPFDGDMLQILPLARGEKQNIGSPTSQQSEFAFIQTPGSSLADEVVIVDREDQQAPDVTQKEFCCTACSREEGITADLRTEFEPPTPESEVDGIGGFVPPKKSKKKKSTSQEVEQFPSPQAITDDCSAGWGSGFSKEVQEVQVVETSHPADYPVIETPPSPPTAYEFGPWAPTTKKTSKKSKNTIIVFEEPTIQSNSGQDAGDEPSVLWNFSSFRKAEMEKKVVEQMDAPLVEVEPVVEDDSWGSFSIKKKSKKSEKAKKGKKGKTAKKDVLVCEEPVVEAESLPDNDSLGQNRSIVDELQNLVAISNPEPVEVVDDLWWDFDATKRDKKKGKNFEINEPMQFSDIPAPEAISESPLPEDDFLGSGFTSKKGKKKKNLAFAVDDIIIDEEYPQAEVVLEPIPEPAPEPIIVDDDGDFRRATKKNGKKSQFLVEPVLLPSPEPNDDLPAGAGALPATDAEVEIPSEDAFSFWGVRPKKVKKKHTWLTGDVEIVPEAAHDMEVPVPTVAEPGACFDAPEPEPELCIVEETEPCVEVPKRCVVEEPERCVVEESEPVPEPSPTPTTYPSWGWGSPAVSKKGKKKNRSSKYGPEVVEPEVCDEESILVPCIKEPECMDELEPEPSPMPTTYPSWRWCSPVVSKKGKMKNKKTHVSEPLEAASTQDLIAIPESPEPTALLVASEKSSPNLLVPSQRPGQTIVFTIQYPNSILKTASLEAMLTLKDNTRDGIFDVLNRYLDSRGESKIQPRKRSLQIMSGVGRNGEVDVSELEETMWPDYIEYFCRYTKLPELTVHVLD